ncbi:MAG: hypothetical protein M3485_01130 [Pseudomonadota bacterium]|nr:hypothetical protein [Pseudomonadota bacterium]
MTPLAMLSVLASEMPRVAAWPLALATLVYGACLARREWRRPQRELVFSGASTPVLVDGEPAAEVVLQWRGPLTFLRWRAGNGRRHRLVWWPDTLPASARRELRLAAPDRKTARGGPSMAP